MIRRKRAASEKDAIVSSASAAVLSAKEDFFMTDKRLGKAD